MVEGVKEKLIVEVAECLRGRTDHEILEFYISTEKFARKYAVSYELEGPMHLVLDNSIIQSFKHRATKPNRDLQALSYTAFTRFVTGWSDRETYLAVTPVALYEHMGRRGNIKSADALSALEELRLFFADTGLRMTWIGFKSIEHLVSVLEAVHDDDVYLTQYFKRIEELSWKKDLEAPFGGLIPLGIAYREIPDDLPLKYFDPWYVKFVLTREILKKTFLFGKIPRVPSPSHSMKQMTFADAEYAGKRKQTRKELFLIEMDRVVPWKGLIALIEPHYPKGEGGRPAYPLMAMLRVHLMQNWFGYSDPAMEEALYETTILRQFAGLELKRIPDETTILNFRRLLEKHEVAAGILGVINGYLGDRGLSLRQGTIVDATLINAPSSTKNKDGKRDPEMHQTKKGNQYYFGAKAHIGVDDESGLVHSVVVTAANVADITQVDKLLHGEENAVCADAGYTGIEKREEHADRSVMWQVAARRSTYKKHGEHSVLYKAIRKIERAKAQVRSKVEHPFRVIKRQFGYTKVRFRGLAKNTAQMVTLFALSNLWMARRHLLTGAGEVRL